MTNLHSGNQDPPPCHAGNVPLWLVLLDNIPTLLLFVLGYVIIGTLSALYAVLYAVYTVASIVWFWGKICPYCQHYGTGACPCGYGIISSKLFERRRSGSFGKIFRKNIIVLFPNWFVPFFIALYLLATEYSLRLLVLTIAFSVTGFAVIPLISKLVGCKNCEIKDNCPWMTKNRDRSC